MVDAEHATLPTRDQVLAALQYDPITGSLTWRWRDNVPLKTNTRFVGKPAGFRNPRGHICVCLNYQIIMAHRLIWIMVHGKWPTSHIDHINGIPHDNRLANLREADTAQNGWNTGTKRSNTSGVKGVHQCRVTGRWVVQIRVNGPKRTIGRYDTLEEAAAAYKAAAEFYHGEFARAA